MELISVIIPIYKVELYLKSCINSVLAQTYDNLEIILVDDGSPDNCPQICDDYEKKDKRVKVIHKKNGGLSDARNVGISCSTGDYLCFIDSDDMIHPKMIEILYTVLKKNASEISVCDFFRDPILCEPWVKIDNTIENFTSNYNDKNVLYFLFDGRSVVATVAWNKLYKRELFETVKYPIGKIHEDEFTTYKLLCLAKKVTYLDLPLYFYRQREDSIMNTGNEIKHLVYYEARIMQLKYFKKLHEKNIALKSAYSTEFQLLSKLNNKSNTKEINTSLKKYFVRLIMYSFGVVPFKYTLLQIKEFMKL